MPKVIKTGHSLAVVIPARLAKVMGIRARDTLHMKVLTEKNKIILTFPGTQQLPLSLDTNKRNN